LTFTFERAVIWKSASYMRKAEDLRMRMHYPPQDLRRKIGRRKLSHHNRSTHYYRDLGLKLEEKNRAASTAARRRGRKSLIPRLRLRGVLKPDVSRQRPAGYD
jgi:hypothetical protein